MSGRHYPVPTMPAPWQEREKRADPGFHESAGGGNVVMLGYPIATNTIAVIFRRRDERRWHASKGASE